MATVTICGKCCGVFDRHIPVECQCTGAQAAHGIGLAGVRYTTYDVKQLIADRNRAISERDAARRALTERHALAATERETELARRVEELTKERDAALIENHVKVTKCCEEEKEALRERVSLLTKERDEAIGMQRSRPGQCERDALDCEAVLANYESSDARLEETKEKLKRAENLGLQRYNENQVLQGRLDELRRLVAELVRK